MPASETVIAALRYRGGAILAADSQVSDPLSGARWSEHKLQQVGQHPIVIGFSGNTGPAQRAIEGLGAAKFHANMFKKRELIRNAVDRAVDPAYQRLKAQNDPLPPDVPAIWRIGLRALSAFWAQEQPHILEFEHNGDATFHEHFHAIGSGARTARAVWLTVGGEELEDLDEDRALWVMLRIMRTCIRVEMSGVNEPLRVWIVSAGSAQALSSARLDAELQLVDEWERRNLRDLLEA